MMWSKFLHLTVHCSGRTSYLAGRDLTTAYAGNAVRHQFSLVNDTDLPVASAEESSALARLGQDADNQRGYHVARRAHPELRGKA